MFIIGTGEQSERLLAELCHIEEEIFTELGLHYRKLVIAPAYLGRSHSDAKTLTCKKILL